MLKRTAHMAVTLGLTAATVAATGTVAAAEHGDNSVVRTDKGAVRGTTTGPVRAFRGIPYAAAPTGDRRWTPPAPAAGCSGVRDATRRLRRQPGLALGAVLTDADQARRTVDTGRTLARGVRTYTYEFADHETPWYADAATYPKPSFPMGATHTFELPYLFELTEFDPLTEPQQALSDTMIRIWSNFARTGKAPWKPTTTASPNAQSLASGPDGVHPVDFAKDHQYDFWKSLD
ncbi:carboxylesterase family protein [Streptomyces rubrogriseus]|uniref:carboxylesterase family protein n=1 Tax=Streptomyces rubrogriseus TaxID=194673 RepID=UPI0036FD4409